MRNLLFASVSAFVLFTITLSHADPFYDDDEGKPIAYKKQPDDHAPIGVNADHLHKKGEWMVGYKYKTSKSTGLRSGSHSVDIADVLLNYGEAPMDMRMDMHMIEIMYGINNDLTLMVMPQYMKMDMTHKAHGHGGHIHKHRVEGWGDTEVMGLYSLFRNEQGPIRHRAHLNFGVSLPTGSINETFVNHHNNTYHLPYNMQLGSGTFDPILGLTYTGEVGDWSWGAQTLNYLRTGTNDEGYRLGNKYMATAWVARNLTDFASLSLRVEGEAWGDVSGSDAKIPLTSMAGADPDQQAGERVLGYIGINLMADPKGPLAGQRLAIDFGLPLYERYDGPQPETDYRLTVGWQMAF